LRFFLSPAPPALGNARVAKISWPLAPHLSLRSVVLSKSAGIVCRDRHPTSSVPATSCHPRAARSITLPLFLSFQRLADSFSLLPLFFRTPILCLQSLADSFCKNTGVWGRLYSCHSPVSCHACRITQLCASFVFMVLQIAFPASPFLSQSSALPSGVTPRYCQKRKDEAPPQPMIGFCTPWHQSHRA